MMGQTFQNISISPLQQGPNQRELVQNQSFYIQHDASQSRRHFKAPSKSPSLIELKVSEHMGHAQGEDQRSFIQDRISPIHVQRLQANLVKATSPKISNPPKVGQNQNATNHEFTMRLQQSEGSPISTQYGGKFQKHLKLKKMMTKMKQDDLKQIYDQQQKYNQMLANSFYSSKTQKRVSHKINLTSPAFRKYKNQDLDPSHILSAEKEQEFN